MLYEVITVDEDVDERRAAFEGLARIEGPLVALEEDGRPRLPPEDRHAGLEREAQAAGRRPGDA